MSGQETRERAYQEQHRYEANRILASAAHFLIQGHENEAAVLLLFCDLDYETDLNDYTWIMLDGPRVAYDALDDANGQTDLSQTVGRASGP